MAVVIVKDIVAEDVPQIKELLKNTVGDGEYADLQRLGGLTNHTYRAVMADGKEYAVRIPGEGTEEVISRRDEQISTKLACDLDIDAHMLFFGEDGTKVTEYLKDAVTMDEESMQEPKHIEQAAAIFRKLHDCGVDTGVPFEVFDMAAGYEKFIEDNGVTLFDDYEERKKQVIAFKNEVEKNGVPQKVPCHNDPLCANWIESEGRLYLVDWEYAGMNDGMWDLAAVSIESGFNEEQDLYFLEKYLGHTPSTEEHKHMIASKVFVDYLWTLWAKMRVPFDGQPMEDWAAERYERMVGFIEQFEAM